MVKLLESFSLVESVITLVAFFAALATGYLMVKVKNRSKLLPKLLDKADTLDKQNLVRDLMGVIPSEKLNKLGEEYSFELLKLDLERKQSELREKFRLLRLIVIMASLVIIINLGQNYYSMSKTYGDDSPIIEGDDARVEYNN